ncbi:hypothetical protein [Allobranchiibius sp. GilTou73]|uniref:hypothetical protein n=1 Tax=Allobranchiibius sp. GilTou73 TaxID=2904523 RepID=UPI001F3F39FA|nr:hypothetical protein [Allobranchiibius sp. GilTou73]UIJ36377.1 hypothetical protein LVQ62_08460 [Allobranchiibius sp. GilTou73]
MRSGRHSAAVRGTAVGASARWLPAAVCLVASYAAAHTHVPLGQSAIYLVATVWSVVVPGVLVLRLCRGQADSLLAELSVGFVVGIMVQLVAWAAFVSLGVGGWLALYPLPLVAAAALIPPWRARLRTAPYARREPWWAAWSLAASYVVAVGLLATRTFAANPLPPSRVRWYPDLYWHVAVAASARTSVPPAVPQVSGQTLKYHWFSHAHMAADSLVSHVDVLLVASRLWYLPVYAAILVLTYLLATRLARTPKAGVLALVLLVVNAGIDPLRWANAFGSDALIPLSPSEILGLPVLLVTTWWVIDIVRGARPTRAGWVLFGLMLLTCAGSKSSNLPVLVCGLLLVVAGQLIRRRRRTRGPSRSGAADGPVAMRATLIALAMAVVVIGLTAPFLAGGSNVSTLKTFALSRNRAAALFGSDSHPGGPLLYGLLIVFSVLTLLQFAALLMAVPLRADPAVVLLAGMLIGGFSATQLVFHPSDSEVYFLRGVVPLSEVLIAWGVAVAVHRIRPPLWVLGVSALAGGAVLSVVRRFSGTRAPGPHSALVTVAVSVGVCVLLLIAGVLAWRRCGPPVRGVLIGLLVGAVVIPAAVPIAQTGLSRPTVDEPSNLLTSGDIAGTTWLRTHTPDTTLIATNVHCRAGMTHHICDARALWVTGLGLRRAYVESWGYTDQAYATAKHPHPGEKGVFYWSASFYDQPRLRLNDAAFNAPTAYDLRYLYDHGVRYLFGSTRASAVSPELANLAQQVFHQGDVTIFRLRRP